mmetsp:Transcript_20425/g.34220  ORF Transcript_20425/g.34220 Transcript_20425/m.34220 type:complete len:254 (-) Transcript_20425:600-1361(-)
MADPTRPRVWIEVDINNTRQAYQTACDFVAARNFACNLTSNNLEELGGSEKKRVKEVLYPNDFEWSQKGRICLKMPPERITFELYPERSPLAVENFIALIKGNKGIGDSGRPLHYKGCCFHRVIKGFVAQGGDFVMNNGTGGESIHGKKFKDDKDGLKLKIDKRGVLAMGNTGKNSNSSQFFISLADVNRLTGKHVVFGEMVEGDEVLTFIESCGTEKDDVTDGVPKYSVIIADCGVVEGTCDAYRSVDETKK